MSTWTKKAMFVGLPRYLEQLLGACYAKEGWELYRFRAVEGERPPQGIHTYDCEVDSAEAAQVFSVQNLDLLVYRLERDPSVAMRRLDALLRMAQESAVKQVFLLSDDEVFAAGTQPTERDAVNPQNADGRLFVRLEELGMAYRAQGSRLCHPSSRALCSGDDGGGWPDRTPVQHGAHGAFSAEVRRARRDDVRAGRCARRCLCDLSGDGA